MPTVKKLSPDFTAVNYQTPSGLDIELMVTHYQSDDIKNKIKVNWPSTIEGTIEGAEAFRDALDAAIQIAKEAK